jgi:hypothetical protein
MTINTSMQSRESGHLPRPGVGKLPALPIALLVALVLALLPSLVSAQTPDLRPTALAVSGPENALLGNLARISAVLRDGNGNPIADARIIFTSPATFAGTTGEMAIGEAWTDAKGMATLEYQLRIRGENQFIARFYGSATHQPSEASTVVLTTGRKQLVQRTAGVELPVLGPWTIIAVLGGIWGVYFIAMLLVVGIPQQQTRVPRSERPGPEPRFETGGHP